MEAAKMAKQQLYKGTWEEIKRHESALAGKYLHVSLVPEPKSCQTSPPEVARTPRVLTGQGKYKGMTGGSAAAERNKREDLAREERGL